MNPQEQEPVSDASGLCVLWVSDSREAALNMGLMYAVNSLRKGWWSRVRLLVWGPSALLLSHDPELREEVQALSREGGEILACRQCAERYSVAETLERLGVDVRYIGEEFTHMLCSGWKIITV